MAMATPRTGSSKDAISLDDRESRDYGADSTPLTCNLSGFGRPLYTPKHLGYRRSNLAPADGHRSLEESVFDDPFTLSHHLRDQRSIYETEGHRFESSRARFTSRRLRLQIGPNASGAWIRPYSRNGRFASFTPSTTIAQTIAQMRCRSQSE